MIEKEFIPYEEALALKKLGFDEPCFGFYERAKELIIQECEITDFHFDSLQCIAPTFSQAFRWIREKYWYTALILCDSFQIVTQLYTTSTLASGTWEWKPNYVTQTRHQEEGLKSYDESELACLRQLIEIANEQQ